MKKGKNVRYGCETVKLPKAYSSSNGQNTAYLDFRIRMPIINGTLELIVADMSTDIEGHWLEHAVLGAYSLGDGVPQYDGSGICVLAQSITRGCYYLSSMGDFYCAGSSGAMESTYSILNLHGARLEPKLQLGTSESEPHYYIQTVNEENGMLNPRESLSAEELQTRWHQLEDTINPVGPLVCFYTK